MKPESLDFLKRVNVWHFGFHPFEHRCFLYLGSQRALQTSETENWDHHRGPGFPKTSGLGFRLLVPSWAHGRFTLNPKTPEEGMEVTGSVLM